MAKAVLISIRPGWVEEILSGKKTLELRKTKPKLKTPFKCYIYCALGRGNAFGEVFGGLVVGEFVCDRIESVFGSAYLKMPESAFAESCLNMFQIDTYLDGKDGYFWHISDLKVYDKPKRISQFTSICRFRYEDHECLYREVLCNCQKIDYNPDGLVNVALCTKKMKRPPQSWCYVEELT